VREKRDKEGVRRNSRGVYIVNLYQETKEIEKSNISVQPFFLYLKLPKIFLFIFRFFF